MTKIQNMEKLEKNYKKNYCNIPWITSICM